MERRPGSSPALSGTVADHRSRPNRGRGPGHESEESDSTTRSRIPAPVAESALLSSPPRIGDSRLARVHLEEPSSGEGQFQRRPNKKGYSRDRRSLAGASRPAPYRWGLLEEPAQA